MGYLNPDFNYYHYTIMKIKICLTISPENLEKVDKMAKGESRTRSNMIGMLIERAEKEL